MTEITEAATEVVAEVAEEVADGAQAFAEVSRGLTGRDVSLVVGGVLIGGGIGFVAATQLLRKKFAKIAEGEIEQMREHYQKKVLADKAWESKPTPEQLVRDLGYTSEGGDAHGLPERGASAEQAGVSDRSEEVAADAAEGEPVPQEEGVAPQGSLTREDLETSQASRNVFEEADVADEEWDWDLERAVRAQSPDRPYVIHKEEFGEIEGLTSTTFTYYEADDVLCDERDKPIDARDEIVGEENLSKFGHGSMDGNVLYVRNEHLATEIEICRSPHSYASEVHGLRHGEDRMERMRRTRRPADDDD